MKFGLKTLLIAFAIVGVTAGWMSRLWIIAPEVFFRLLTIGTTIVPFVLAAATIIWLGLRGSRPTRWLAVWGGLLLAMPLLGLLAHRILLPTGQPIRVLSTKRLIEHRLPSDLDSPWIWNELEYRLGRSQLSKPHAEAAVRTLTAHMKQNSPNGWNQPLSWQRNFLTGARQQGLLSDEVLMELAEAFYGPRPTIHTIADLPAGDHYVPLHVEYGNPWEDNSRLGVKLLWHVERVSLDGEAVMPQDVQKHFGRDWNGHFRATLSPGEHEVALEIESALIKETGLAGMDPNSLTPDQWPKALKRWRTRVTAPFVVQPGGNP